jgi:predicted tellurium resistance membrane protein TerC
VFDALLDPGNLVALLTLTILEIVLGIDNVIFIAIVSTALPKERRNLARKLGLSLALVGRVAMVLGITWLLGIQRPLFTILEHEFSLSDVILIAGGLFLIYKAVKEIFITTELREEEQGEHRERASLPGVIAQIVVIDMIFAIDSVLTAIGLTSETVLIVIAITIAILVMMFYAGPLSEFIHRHVSVKILALSFLVVIGLMLFAEGFGQHVDRNLVYAAILFALAVEYLNFRRRRNLARRRAPLDETGEPITEDAGS